MKELYFIFACMFTMLCFANSVTAQTNYKVEQNVVNNTLNINNKTYLYNNKDKVVRNSLNKVLNNKYSDRIRIKIETITPIEDVYKKVFNPQRIDELGDSRIMIECLCTGKGNIVEVNFYIKRAPKVTVEELSKLEDELKKYTFRVIGASPKQKYYKVYTSCRFDEIK